MKPADPIIYVALFSASLLAATLFGYIYRLKRQAYQLWWMTGWLMISLHYAIPLLANKSGSFPGRIASSPVMSGLSLWLLSAASLLFLGAARQYAQKDPRTRMSLLAGGALAVWTALHMLGWFTPPPFVAAGALLIVVAVVFWEEGQKQESLADTLLAGAFVLWGIFLFAPLFREWIQPYFGPEARLMAIIPQMFTVVLMVMAQYEEEKRRIERNMVALSNLNLTTSGFVGGEIQKMLSQALERVLSVARIPAGALFLHHGDPAGPTSVVAIGLSDSFCARTQEESLDDHLVGMVARVGGLVIFHDLHRADKWTELEKRDLQFRRFRAQALEQHLRTVVGISLQAKERVFGLLLLGTPDNRRFTPAELRLLLALSHQIGMAVENSYLIQQTARRTEELHIMNEIGRALSSTLDIEALFDKIYAEIQRLFDVSSFYIAFYNPSTQEIEFRMEVSAGERVAPRSRKAGNHLTEYIIRTQQPVLIRDNFVDEVRRLGCDPIQTLGSFCGVPLVLHDRGIGAMAAHSNQDRVFDEGHLELMRVLASEASIAIDNARLFSEQQERSMQLALLNDVSRHAIATLNPEEMLAKIVQELETGLFYDYIGIGLLDYSSKEIVIQAEAGRKRSEHSSLGVRIPLGEMLVGHVARSGEMSTLQQMAASGKIPQDERATVLPAAAAAIAFPVVYAEQLQGVFFAETLQRYEFSEAEVRLLRTLGDLIASALHNAFTFQRAQEQAITDGLTGVKTHRYFMEALSAEWKRATRANRPFSLVLLDLDRFKFVNDFYGHLEGDLVLQRVAHILEQNCRSSDVVARYGGDEFVILMPETNLEQGRQLASKIRVWIATEPMLRDKNTTASIGVASFPLHGSTPQELIQVADASMYLSKHQGGNAVSTADAGERGEGQRWKRDVLEAYLGVTLKRLFTTGPEAFEEISRRLEQFTHSLSQLGAEPAVAPGAPGILSAPAVLIDTLAQLSAAVDSKDPYTTGHSRKVAAYSVVLCRALGFSDAETEEIRFAAILHDVGKVGIPEVILNKAGPLDSSEWQIMKTHASLGAQLLETVPAMEAVRNIVRFHHEFMDGSGYPDGLSGRSIPPGARIVAIADAYDTITSDRTYKKGRRPEDALKELERCAGLQFDAEFVRAFVRTMRARTCLLIAPEDPLADSLFSPPEAGTTLAGAPGETKSPGQSAGPAGD
jgi:diguanylate cyclase (GGDEF)-like protein/putative nucleotidyltransferase with HDIG domain